MTDSRPTESVDDVIHELADRPLSEEQQEEMFRRLDDAAEREAGS